jgi:hypothetical protein
MGKGAMGIHQGDGKYFVTLKYNLAYCTARINALNARLAALAIEIASLPAGDEKTKKQLEYNSLALEKSYIQAHFPSNPIVEAWCADLTEDLAGDVGIIEIAEQEATGFNIQPGYGGNAAYNAARDGLMTPAICQDWAGLYWNWALRPGSQKWKPGYRYGTITAIDYGAHTCSVEPDVTVSEDQHLYVNQTGFAVPLLNVPIVYMDCNSNAFEVGDKVIIKFTGRDWTTPKVIGFKANPQKCCTFTFVLNSEDGTVITLASGKLVYFEIYDYLGNYLDTSWEWDSTHSRWCVSLDDPADYDAVNGHFIDYYVTTFAVVPVQYPRRYKAADKRDSDDLTFIGHYTESVPYWSLTNRDPILPDCSCDPIVFPGFYAGEAGTPREIRIIDVEASVEYQVSFVVNGLMSGLFYGQFYFCHPTLNTCEQCLELAGPMCIGAYSSGAGYLFNDDLLVSTDQGDLSTNTETNPISAVHTVGVEGVYAARTHTIEVVYTGDEPRTFTQPCLGGTVDFPLEFTCAKVGANAISAAPIL